MPLEDQKVHPERYQIIPRVLIFSMREEKILLIKGSPQKKLWPNLYNGIGGHIEKGENILSAAKREFFEETGLRLLNPRLRAVVTIDTKKNLGIGLFVFTGETDSSIPTPSSEGVLEWVDSNMVGQLPLVEDLEILIPKVIKKTPKDLIIFGQYQYNENDKLVMTFDEENY